MENSLTDRVKIVMETEGYSPSTFADMIGVQRPSMSHILSGRNKPSIDIVQKIILSFPQYNPIWLINGTGAMLQLDLFESEDDLREKKDEKSSAKTIAPKKTKPSMKNINFVKEALENNLLDDDFERKINLQTTEQPKNAILLNQPITEASTAVRSKYINEAPVIEQINFNTPTMNTETITMEEPIVKDQPMKNVNTSPIPPLFGITDKKIERIVVFYADKTFSVYNPE